MQAEAIYARLREVLTAERAGLLHPEFPIDVVARRFRLARRLPFYVTDNYVGQLAAGPEGLGILKLMRFGEVRAAEIIAFFARAVRLGALIGHRPRVEDPTSRTLPYYREVDEVVGEGAYFFVHDPAVRDPLDDFDPERSWADPFGSEVVPGLGHLSVGLFSTTVHLAPGCVDPMPVLARLAARNAVVTVSSRSREDVAALHRALAARSDLVVGRPDAYYACRVIPERLASYARFAERHPVRMRLLVEGRFHELA